LSFTLNQLETFRLLAEEENFTRTAERLHLTQPAVTQHVRALEAHFGVKLVDLVGRKTVLTDAGRFLAARANVLLGNVDALEREMREFADVRAGELRIGATVTIGAYALPDLIARFRSSAPDVRLRIEVENTEAIAAALKIGRISLALVEGPLADPDLIVEAYADDKLTLIVAPTHPFATRKRIKALELADQPFVFREDGSGTRLQIERALAGVGVEPNVVLTLPTGEGIVRAVELGIGVAIVSTLVAEAPAAMGRVVKVPIGDLELVRTFRAVRLRWQTPSPAVVAFIALLREGSDRRRTTTLRLGRTVRGA
jgi:DNA-binding transcriptional LysR family regulator